MTDHRARVLRIERTFDAPVARVFEAWTSEEVLRRWLHGMPGWDTPTAEVDLRVGGTIRIVMRDPSDGTEAGATGEYRVVEPARRLVFTWVWDDQPERPQLIELEFSERDGRTSTVASSRAVATSRALSSGSQLVCSGSSATSRRTRSACGPRPTIRRCAPGTNGAVPRHAWTRPSTAWRRRPHEDFRGFQDDSGLFRAVQARPCRNSHIRPDRPKVRK